jgi:hypothetical protein
MLKPSSYRDYLEAIAASYFLNERSHLVISDPNAPVSMRGYAVSGINALDEIRKQRAERLSKIQEIPLEDQLAHSEKRWNQLKNWLQKQANLRREQKKPYPHPLDLSFCTPEESHEKMQAIRDHNFDCETAAAAYEYVLEAIQNTEKQDRPIINPQLNYEI